MIFQTIRLEVENKIATLVLDRPTSENVINSQMAAEFRDACNQLNQNDAIWVIILTGEGKKF